MTAKLSFSLPASRQEARENMEENLSWLSLTSIDSSRHTLAEGEEEFRIRVREVFCLPASDSLLLWPLITKRHILCSPAAKSASDCYNCTNRYLLLLWSLLSRFCRWTDVITRPSRWVDRRSSQQMNANWFLCLYVSCCHTAYPLMDNKLLEENEASVIVWWISCG